MLLTNTKSKSEKIMKQKMTILFFLLLLIVGCSNSPTQTGSSNLNGNAWQPSGRADFQFSGRMVLIKAAGHSFMMGSNNSCYGELPSHSVTFTKDFYMDTSDVTQAQYQAVMDTNPSYFTGDLNRPVESVTWYDAVRYCNRRSVLDGLTPCYDTLDTVVWNCSFSNNGYRLPTEAEWEYSCRAGTTTEYYWGNDSSATTVKKYAWYYSDGNDSTQPVAQKLPNAYGLYDMSGNVWQWCNDWYDSYSQEAQTDPTGPTTGSFRVLRGGAYYNNVIDLRSVVRSDYALDLWWADSPWFTMSLRSGFRCVRQ